jgi:predicted membrane GTPase involved in stress response
VSRTISAVRITHAPGLAAPTGLVERLMGVVDIAILAVWAHRAAHTRTHLVPA